MNYTLSDIMDETLILEMTQQVINYVDAHREELPFDDIFDGKMRIYVPIPNDKMVKMMKKITNFINDNIENVEDIDFDTGMVTFRKKMNAAYRGGDYKLMKMRLGKLITEIEDESGEYDKVEMLDVLARFRRLNDDSGYGIIITRAPIDVVRMSDINNIQSCHSRGKSHFQCAVADAVTGGVVAYLVRRDDYEALSEEEFQEDDLFGDDERGVAGYDITPIARLRVRRYKLPSGEIRGIPETRIYTPTNHAGNRVSIDVPYFPETLIEFFRSKQPPITSADFSGDGDIYMYGGSYVDTDLENSLRAYLTPEEMKEITSNSDADFDTTVTRVAKQHERDFTEDADEDDMEELENEARRELDFLIDREEFPDNVNMSYNVEPAEEGGYLIITMMTSYMMDFSDYDLLKKFDDMNHIDSYDLERGRYPTNTYMPNVLGVIGEIMIYWRRNYDIDDASVGIDDGEINIFLSEAFLELSDVEAHILSVTEAIDYTKSDNMRDKFRDALIADGYIEDKIGDSNYSMYNLGYRPYKNVTLDGRASNPNTLEIKLSEFNFLDGRLLETEGSEILNKLRVYPPLFTNLTPHVFKSDMYNFIKDVAKTSFRPKPLPSDHDGNMTLDGILESILVGETSFDIKITEFKITNDGPWTLFLGITLKPSTMNNIGMEFVQFIDDIYKHIVGFSRAYAYHLLVKHVIRSTSENRDVEEMEEFYNLINRVFPDHEQLMLIYQPYFEDKINISKLINQALD